MKLNNAFVLLFGILPLWPQYHSTAQGTKETIRHAKEVIRSDSTAAVVDSLASVNDSIAGTNLKIVQNLERVANTLPEKLKDLSKDVQKLAKRKDTIAVRFTKYIPVPETVDKDLYYLMQRRYTDSIARAKKDSILKRWKDRTFFGRLFHKKPKL